MKKTLPLKNGVPASKIWAPKGDWQTMLDFLCDRFKDVSKKQWQSRMHREMVLTEYGVCLKPDSRYQADQRIYYYREVEDELPFPFDEKILYQDEHLLVADKPHFMQIIPRGRYLHQTLLVRLQNSLQMPELSPLHRLDRETAGVVLFSKTPQTRSLYQEMFAKREMHKVYHAIASKTDSIAFPTTVESRIERGEPFFKMHQVEGETNAITHINVLKESATKALYELQPVSGKTHQLRVHMAALGIAIENDPIYPHLNFKDKEDYSHPLELLSKSISFQCPLTQKSVEFVSEKDLVLN